MYYQKLTRNNHIKPIRQSRSLCKVIKQVNMRQPTSDPLTNPVQSVELTDPSNNIATPAIVDQNIPTCITSLDPFSHIRHLPDFPIIVTAYTTTSHLGNYYQKTVARLTRSCIRFNLPHIVYPLMSVNNWLQGCNLKPTVISHALQLFNKPILWLDADAEIFKFPAIFNDPEFKYDIALTAEAPPSGHWLSGTLYCKPTALKFIESWRDCTPQSKITDSDADEITIRRLWHNTDANTRPKLHLLPSPYNSVVHTKTDLSNVIIGHYIREDIAPFRNCVSVPVPEL